MSSISTGVVTSAAPPRPGFAATADVSANVPTRANRSVFIAAPFSGVTEVASSASIAPYER
jgi:hypothetical protein